VKVWAIANQKGGVGKTTTTVNLAGLLAISGNPTLIIDLDPQGSLTSYMGYNPDIIEKSAYQLFQGRVGNPASFMLETGISNLDLLPASSALATLDRQLGAQLGKGLVIKNFLDSIRENYSHVLIDCPPVVGMLLVNAIAASDTLILPVQTEYLALKGLERMVNTIQMIERSRKREIPYLVVPTMFDQRTRASMDAIRQLQEFYSSHLWNGVVPVDTLFRDASRLGVPLTLWNTRARGSEAYARLLRSLLATENAQRTAMMQEARSNAV